MAKWSCAALLCLLPWGSPAGAGAQQAPSPDTIVALNEGIHHYLQGRFDPQRYTVAIERLNHVVESQPDHTTALLFLALSHGELGLIKRDAKRNAQRLIEDFKQVLQIRNEPTLEKDRQGELREATADLERGSPAERRVARAQLDRIESLMELLEDEVQTPAAELERKLTENTKEYYEFAKVERDHYSNMIASLQALVRQLEHPEAVIRLVEVVAEANVARIDEQHARGLADQELPADDRSKGELRADAARRLEQAADLLSELLDGGLDGFDLIRTKFFKGILRYRQAVPLVGEGESRRSGQRERLWLGEAERLMVELSDDEEAGVYRSYAALYLGLILPFLAVDEPSAQGREQLLDDAQRWLATAAQLDFAAGPRRSSAIPDLVGRQRAVITELRLRRAGTPILRKDISLSLYGGVRYDTNVVLLGERTDLPRDVSQKWDFGLAGGAAIDYTWDFADRWTLGAQGRTSQIFNADVHEFDQQVYGGSVALQYELLPERAGEVGPAYLGLQYDFEYALLGREGFLTSNAITPNLRLYWMDRRAITDLAFTYDIRNYFEPLVDRRFNRDGDYFRFGLAQSFKTVEMTAIYENWGLEPWGSPNDEALVQTVEDYPERYLTPYVGVGYAWDSTDGDEFDRNAWALSMGLTLPLPRGWTLDASAALEWEDYVQRSLVDFHRRGREDLVQEYAVVLSRTFVLGEGRPEHRSTPTFDHTLFTVRAYAAWTDDDSNVEDRLGQAVYSYDRAIYGLSFALTIN